MVHRLLAPASRALLEEVAAAGHLGIVVDLGCGPGATSRLIHEVLGPARLIGLDVSERFLQLARAAVPHGEFHCRDVRQLPWPGSPADLVYARYLLTHLLDPEVRTGEWMSQLRSGGLLVLEENEWIECSQPVFAEYLEIVGQLLADHGQDLYVGRRLTAIEQGLQRICRVFEVPAPTAPAATMFRLNLSAWAPRVPPSRRSEVTSLDRSLADLEASTDPHGITWGLRQLVFQRP
jgi:SAM-dependent methyltransferase